MQSFESDAGPGLGQPTAPFQGERQPINRLVLVIPSQGLDDFPVYLADDLADNFLASWTLLWHPQVICAANAVPEWKKPDAASLDVQSALILCPKVSNSKINATISERFPINSCSFLLAHDHREATLEHIASLFGIPSQQLEINDKSLELFALGYAYFQLQLLTRRLRYSANFEQPVFVEQVLEAAKAAVANDDEKFEHWIQAAFDQLAQDRDRYYSQSAYLLDVTLLAETTLGNSLKRQLADDSLTSYLASSKLLSQLRDRNTENFHALRSAVLENRSSIVGGCDDDRPLSLQTDDALRRCLERADAEYERLEFPKPYVFASLGSWLPFFAPRELRNHGYEACLIHAWTSGQYPEGRQSKITWEGPDGSSVDAIAKNILDANAASSFLTLGSRLGEQLDYHQVPTLVFAHWPGQRSEWFQLLKRATRRTPFLGNWKEVGDYFKTTQRPYYQDRLPPNEFVPGNFPETNESLKSIGSYYQCAAHLQSAFVMEIMARQLSSWKVARKRPAEKAEVVGETDRAELEVALEESSSKQAIELDCDSLAHALDVSFNLKSIAELANGSEESVCRSRLDQLRLLITEQASRWSERLRNSLPRNTKMSSSSAYIVFNPLSGPSRRFLEDLEGVFVASEGNRIYASHYDGTRSKVIVDLPPMGFVRLVPADRSEGAPKERSRSIVVAPNALSNEFLEVHLHPQKGYIKGVYLPGLRGNFCSGMLAIGHPSGDNAVSMLVSSIEMVESSSILGRVLVRGELIQERRCAAKFELTYSLWRGSRMIEISGRLRSIDFSEWNDAKYLSWRWAWPSFSSIYSAWLGGIKTALGPMSGFSPYAVEVDETDNKFLILSSGAMIHRRVGDRFLDTVLAFEKAQEIEFRLGIGVNVPRPFQTSLEWKVGSILLKDEGFPCTAGESAWFLQCNMPNVYVTPIKVLNNSNDDVVGMRLLVRETESKSGTASIRFFRDVKSARWTGGRSQSLGTLSVAGDAVSIPLRGNESATVDVIWTRD